MLFNTHGIAVIALSCLAFCVYINSLGCGFVFDDASAIKDNKDLRPTTPISNLFWNDFWGTPMHKERSHKSYRPLCVLTFRINYAFTELDPFSYHLVNAILHVIVCCLYFLMCKMFVDCTCSFIAAVLFAVHPIHTEAVTGVVGRAELLSSIFFILALITYSKCSSLKSGTRWRWLGLSILLVTIAMLCKEQGITVIGVCCVYEVFVAQRMTLPQILSIVGSVMKGKPAIPGWLWSAVMRSLCLVSSTVCLLMARVKVMGAQLPVFTKFDNPAAAAESPTRQLTLNYLLPVNSWLLLNPSNLCCDWTMGTLPLVNSFFDIRNLATLIFYAVVFKLISVALQTRGQKSRAILMSLSLMALPFLPASNLFFPVGFVVAERILYAPSMGFCLLVALGFQCLYQHKQKLRPLLGLSMILLVMLHSLKTVIRNYDWESEYTLFQAALKVNRHNAKLYNNVGHALEAEQKLAEALQYFEQAAKVQPDDIGAHLNVGRTLNLLNRSTEAEQAYRIALELFPPIKQGQSYTARIAPNHLNVFLNLGSLIAKDDSRLLEADALYRTAIGMRSDYTQAYINRGDVLIRLDRTKDAQEQYEIALHLEPDNPDIHYNLGVVHLGNGEQTVSLRYFEDALALEPTHKQSLFNSAVLMQEMGKPELRPTAKSRLLKLSQLEPWNEKVFFNLGMLAMDERQFDEAEQWFKQAIQLKEDFRSALFNLALMIVNDLQRPLDAVPYLQQLLKFHPQHSKGLILMGDINMNHVRDIEAAEQNFLAILEHEPSNVQARHNLCVVYVERGQLGRAEQCLQAVHQMAPQEEYIKRHLDIVRSRIQQYKAAQQQQQNEQQGDVKAQPKQPESNNKRKNDNKQGNGER